MAYHETRISSIGCRDEYVDDMATIRTLIIVSLLGLAGCSSVPVASGPYPTRAYCPDGTYMICEEGSARGCGCGHLIVLN